MSSTNFEFQRNIPFTEFIENGSWLQKRDPGAYLFGFLFFFTASLITQSWVLLWDIFSLLSGWNLVIKSTCNHIYQGIG